MASQLEPSCSSPSPTTTKVRRADSSSLPAKAVPTAIGRPWPERSGAGLDRRDLGPGRVAVELRHAACMNVASSSGRKEAGDGQRRVERGGGVALGQDEPVPLGVVEPGRATCSARAGTGSPGCR